MQLESVKDESAGAARGVTPAAPAPHTYVGGGAGLVGLQRSAGNRAVSGLVLHVQRCGGTTHPGCECESGGGGPLDELMGKATAEQHVVQREGETVVQREGEK